MLNKEGRDAMSVETMQQLFFEELKDLYSAEKQITKALPKLAKAAKSEELRSAFENHLRETQQQVERLERIGEMAGKNLSGKTCNGMKGLLEEGSEMVEEMEKGELRDAALISAAQRVEHYEMAGYGTVREYARLLEMPQAATLLDETLKEEESADQKLTSISKRVNAEAKRITNGAHTKKAKIA
jgi:ferritin-like metal-binding protein YciE